MQQHRRAGKELASGPSTLPTTREGLQPPGTASRGRHLFNLGSAPSVVTWAPAACCCFGRECLWERVWRCLGLRVLPRHGADEAPAVAPLQEA